MGERAGGRETGIGSEPGPRVSGLLLEPVMGTIVSIDARTALDPVTVDDALAAAAAVLHQADAAFSTFRADSWVSRHARGEVTLEAMPSWVADVYRLAEWCRVRTGGLFDAGWRGDGTLDPTGLVKGWAAAAASASLAAAGVVDHCVNAAGDIRLRGVRGPEGAWRAGIADPLDSARLVAIVEASDLSVATSGTAVNADHVIDPRTGRPAVALASVTVVGPDLTLADAYATAGLAAGDDAVALLDDLASDGWSWLVVDAGGGIRRSERFPGLVAVAPRAGKP